MYVNKIDEIIDNVIDDFYNRIILKEFSKYLKDTNFVKFQLEINKSLETYINNLSFGTEELTKSILNKENYAKIKENLKKYIVYYMFLTFAFYYDGKSSTFINNILEFTKNQPKYRVHIDNFFNSESNGIIIKYYMLIKNILILLEADTVRLATLSKNKSYTDAINFLNNLGQDIVDNNFRLKKLNGNVSEQCHNIVKTIIISEIYIKNDKKDLYNFLENVEEEQGEFIYIDIVVPVTEYIDYHAVETALSINDMEKGLVSEIYDLLSDKQSDIYQRAKTVDQKILELIDSGLLIPITEDFLLYHKDGEKYDKIVNNNPLQKKNKEDT